MTSGKGPDEVFEARGFKMVRRGRHLELRTHRSPAEQREVKRRMWESRSKMLAEIQSKTTQFIGLIHKYTSFDLVANLFLRDSMQNPNEYRESESKLPPHWVEHGVELAAVLELKDKQYELRLPPLVDGEDVERAHSLLEEIFSSTMSYYLTESADPNLSGPPSRIDELRFATLLDGMSVRSPAYASHWRDVLRGLFRSYILRSWMVPYIILFRVPMNSGRDGCSVSPFKIDRLRDLLSTWSWYHSKNVYASRKRESYTCSGVSWLAGRDRTAPIGS
jgi:hypothetical protein